MKNIILSIVLSILLLSFAFAQQEMQEQGTGLGVENQTSNINYVIQEKNTNEPMQIENIITETGEQLQIKLKDKNQLELKVGNIIANTTMALTQEQTQLGRKLKVQLSNGTNAEVKVMPDEASERALERLQLKVCSEDNNCSIELKEVGNKNQLRLAYEIQVEKQSKVLGLFKAQMQVQAQVDAETGEVISSKKPWWAFLATENQEAVEEDLVCCKAYGFGSYMEKVNIEYNFMKKEDCSVPEDLVGGNKEIVDNSFCEVSIEE